MILDADDAGIALIPGAFYLSGAAAFRFNPIPNWFVVCGL
jgi:hypothetical protein